MPITGLDSVSLSVLKTLENGIKVKDIPSMYPISLDQAKRLSRYYNFLEKSKEHLTASEIDKIRIIGLKTLYLSPLFQQDDWEGLSEILSSINKRTKRDDYPLLIQALKEKRDRIKGFQLEIDSKLNALKRREQELQQLEVSIKETTKKIKQETKFLNKYPDNVQLFLVKHLGIYNDKLVLARRLDSLWQRSLKKKKILQFADFVYYVLDLDALVADYLKRTNRKVPLGTEWDYEKEDHRNRNGEYPTPYDPEYRLPNGLAVDLRSSLESVEDQITKIKNEQASIMEEMKMLRNTSPQSFMEAVEAKNTLSPYELKLHGELQDKALKWLYNRGFVAASEITLPNFKRADVIGYNSDGEIAIIEVKISIEDYRQDTKWKNYLDHCDEFYFLLNKDARPLYYSKDEYKGVGLLKETKNSLQVSQTHTIMHKATERDKIHFSIAKALSKKYVYGY